MAGADHSVSIVIPVRDRVETLGRAVASALRQGDRVEVLVVDDGSTDGSRDLATALARDERRVRVLTCASAGVGAARNTGARAATGRWLAFLDSDDELRGDWWASLRRQLAPDGRLAAFCGLDVDGRPGPRPSAPGAGGTGAEGVWLPGCFVVDRRTFLEVGGYDESVAFGENTELGLRLAEPLGRPGAVGVWSEAGVDFHGWSPATSARTRARYTAGQRGTGAARWVRTASRRSDAAPIATADQLAVEGIALAELGYGHLAQRRLWRAWRLHPRRVRNLRRTAEVTLGPWRARRWRGERPARELRARRRIVAVTDKSPWPADTGSPQRLFHLLRGLHRVAPIDLVVLGELTSEQRDGIRAAFPGCRLAETPPVRAPRARAWWDLVVHRRPQSLAFRDLAEARLQVASFAADGPALVWCFGAVAYDAVDTVPDIPTVLDLADLPDVWRARVGTLPARAHRQGVSGSTVSRIREVADRRAWRHHLDLLPERVTLAVCSSVDATRFTHGDVVIVPNGTDPVPVGSRDLVRADDLTPPTLLFAGQLSYPPNADAAVWFSSEVLPRIREARPDVHLVLVGRPGPEVEALRGRPGVEVRGYVPSMDPVLGEADVVVVPLRAGSGTRLKILEAWAHGVPVVSTTIGAEGLPAQDGEQLLIADDADGLAAACLRLLDDPALRERLRDRGLATVAPFAWPAIEGAFADEVRRRARRPVAPGGSGVPDAPAD